MINFTDITNTKLYDYLYQNIIFSAGSRSHITLLQGENLLTKNYLGLYPYILVHDSDLRSSTYNFLPEQYSKVWVYWSCYYMGQTLIAFTINNYKTAESYLSISIDPNHRYYKNQILDLSFSLNNNKYNQYAKIINQFYTQEEYREQIEKREGFLASSPPFLSKKDDKEYFYYTIYSEKINTSSFSDSDEASLPSLEQGRTFFLFSKDELLSMAEIHSEKKILEDLLRRYPGQTFQSGGFCFDMNGAFPKPPFSDFDN